MGREYYLRLKENAKIPLKIMQFFLYSTKLIVGDCSITSLTKWCKNQTQIIYYTLVWISNGKKEKDYGQNKSHLFLLCGLNNISQIIFSLPHWILDWSVIVPFELDCAKHTPYTTNFIIQKLSEDMIIYKSLVVTVHRILVTV
jgi:hypothetical protein